MEIKIDIGQIYKFSRRHFQGDVLLYDKTDDYSGARLFVLCEITNVEKKLAQKILSSLARAFTNEYPKPIQSTAMEERLAEVNLRLHEIMRETGTSWLKNFSCALVEIDGFTFNASVFGNAFVYLIRDKRLTPITKPSDSFTPDGVFSDFATGNIHLGDNFLITAKTLFNYVSTDQLTQILSDKSGQGAADAVFEIVNSMVRADEPIMGVVVSAADPNAPTKPKKIKPTKPRSKLNYKYIFLIMSSLGILTFLVIFTAQGLKSTDTQPDPAFIERQELEQTREQLNAAEVAIIRKDTQTASVLLNEARITLEQNNNRSQAILKEDWIELQNRWQTLNNQIR